MRESWNQHSNLLLGSILVAVLGACGAKAHTPQDALHEYAEALRMGDVNRAYALMSVEFRSTTSREEFAVMLKDNAKEAEETAARFAVESSNVLIRAEFEFGHDERLHLVKQGGKWRVSKNPLEFYNQKTPRDAVRSFVRAYEHKRWNIMLRFVPTDYRERMTEAMIQKQFEGPRKEAMEDLMGVLGQNNPISEVQKGDKARLRYGATYVVELVRQQGIWKIQQTSE